MILPYSPYSWVRNDFVRLRRVDPLESASRVYLPPRHDPGDIAMVESLPIDRVEISDEAKRLLQRYEDARLSRGAVS